MDREIEILFRVPNRILHQVSAKTIEKKGFGIAFQYTNQELISEIERADSAIAQAEDNFKIQMEKGEVSIEHRKQFMHAKAQYFIDSGELKDLVLSRLHPILSALTAN